MLDKYSTIELRPLAWKTSTENSITVSTDERNSAKFSNSFFSFTFLPLAKIKLNVDTLVLGWLLREADWGTKFEYFGWQRERRGMMVHFNCLVLVEDLPTVGVTIPWLGSRLFQWRKIAACTQRCPWPWVRYNSSSSCCCDKPSGIDSDLTWSCAPNKRSFS